MVADPKGPETSGSGRPEPGWAIEAEGLGRSFGPVCALRGVSLRLAAGERVAIFGANGAGKTTLLRILATLVLPDRGALRLFGLDPRAASSAARRRIGVVGHRTYLDEALTAQENLAFYGRLYDLPAPRERIAFLLEQVGLFARRDERVRGFSRGMRQRLALARALLHDPDLLLLDEPDTGLDAAGLDLLVGALERPGRPRTIVLASHHPERAAEIASRGLRLERGRLAFDGPIGAATWPSGRDRLAPAWPNGLVAAPT
ncbi:MAG TPA: ABC transporter ATP-binding protein [Chloroflexota bacterium]|jgi:heme exporter protein A